MYEPNKAPTDIIDDSSETTKLTKISEKVLISNVLLPNV